MPDPVSPPRTSTHMPFQHKTFNYFADRDDTPVPLLCRSGPYQTRGRAMAWLPGTGKGARS